jgi:hypothetical protein
MASLLGDLWFWVSAGGFVLSSMLFVFLLGQYRAAVESEEEGLEPELPQPVPITAAPAGQKVYVPKAVVSTEPDEAEPVPAPKPAPKPAAAAPKAEPAPAPQPAAQAPAPKPAPAPAPAAKKPDMSTTGGLSPAVVYLQNLKGQMERLDKDIVNLKQFASQQAAQSDGILKALVALAQKVDSVAQAQKTVADAAARSSTPRRNTTPVPRRICSGESARVDSSRLRCRLAAPRAAAR